MTNGIRRNHTRAFRAKVALAAIKGDRTRSNVMSTTARLQHGGPTCWKRQRVYSGQAKRMNQRLI
jgi:hypothetical protein